MCACADSQNSRNSDHRQNDFPGYDHPIWEEKRLLEAQARALGGNTTKVISLYTGLFLEGAFQVSTLLQLCLIYRISRRRTGVDCTQLQLTAWMIMILCRRMVSQSLESNSSSM